MEALKWLVIKPQSYSWLFPKSVDPVKMNEMFESGLFPSSETLLVAVFYAVVLGLLRSVLHVIFFKVWVLCQCSQSIIIVLICLCVFLF